MSFGRFREDSSHYLYFRKLHVLFWGGVIGKDVAQILKEPLCGHGDPNVCGASAVCHFQNQEVGWLPTSCVSPVLRFDFAVTCDLQELGGAWRPLRWLCKPTRCVDHSEDHTQSLTSAGHFTELNDQLDLDLTSFSTKVTCLSGSRVTFGHHVPSSTHVYDGFSAFLIFTT